MVLPWPFSETFLGGGEKKKKKWKRKKTNSLPESTRTQPGSVFRLCPGWLWLPFLPFDCRERAFPWFTDGRSELGPASPSSEPSGIRSLSSLKDQHMASGNYRVRLIAPSWHGRNIMSPGFSMLTPNPVMPAHRNFPSILPHGRNPHWAAVRKRHLVRFLACAPVPRCRSVPILREGSKRPSRALAATHVP